MNGLRYEKIDELRDLLGFHDRQQVSMTSLVGLSEYDDMEANQVRVRETGDVAFVFVGPRDKLKGERRVSDDGTITYTFTMPGASE